MPAATSDGEFAAMMAAHHESAIEMGRFEITNGKRDDVRALARTMVDQQNIEHVELEGIARAETHAEHKTDPNAERHAKMAIEDLHAAKGDDVDRIFLEQMIEHHTAGVDVTRRSLPNLEREELRRMAQKMISDQSSQIEQMRGMIKR
jgi:uncharacterized protein (DUF305 family)